MKKILSALLTIFIFLSTSTVAANAAEVSYFGSGEEEPASEPRADEDALPSSFSSLEKGWCTPVRTQKGNTCWAYASIASFETLLLKGGMYTVDLNTSSLDLWGVTEASGEGWQRDELDAGYTYIPIGNFTSRSGPLEGDETAAKYGVNSLIYLGKNDRDEIKRTIMLSGAVTANLNSESFAYSKDRNSYALTDEINYMSGHTVEVVGWDDDYDRMKFDGNYLPKNNGAWLCKNSWGPENNTIGGYVWISYEDFYLFNDDFLAPSFGIIEMEPISENSRLYQNEIYGATYEFGYVLENDVTYFNVFDFTEEDNRLDKIIFETTSNGADYEVYYVPLEGDVPTENRGLWKLLGSGTVDYNGYICCDIEDKAVAPKKGAIGVRLDTTKINFGKEADPIVNSVGVTEWLRNRESRKMIFIDQCERGQSFVTVDGGISDIFDFYKNELDDDIGGTLVIKALTNGSLDTKVVGDVNWDGVKDVNDLTLTQMHLVDLPCDFDEDKLFNADINSDGKVDIRDATALQRMLVE